jgi:uncharacterized protein YcbK (DUF882 family)
VQTNKTKRKIQTGSSKRKVKLQKVNCSPKDKKEINDFTCYTDKALYKLRDLWNARHPDVKINTNNTKEIHKLLTEYLSDVCNKESHNPQNHDKLAIFQCVLHSIHFH